MTQFKAFGHRTNFYMDFEWTGWATVYSAPRTIKLSCASWFWIFFFIINLLKTFCISVLHIVVPHLCRAFLSFEGVDSLPCIQERICLTTRTGTDCLPTTDFMTFISSGNFLAVVTLCIVEHPFTVYLLSFWKKRKQTFSFNFWPWISSLSLIHLISIPSHICVPPNMRLQFELFNFALYKVTL